MINDVQVLVAVGTGRRVTLPASLFKHQIYEVSERPDGTLVFVPVPGSEYPS